MKIRKIQLSWFRGSAISSILETNLRNVLVYGANGSGKSTFVDAIEYIISRGKIRHLSHEYSGRKQEKAIINTHIPIDSRASIGIKFDENSCINADIQKDGSSRIQSSPENLLQLIQPQYITHMILRQDELSDFICSSKGEKYSVLLPLLGLDHLESYVNNIDILIREIIEISNLNTIKNDRKSFEDKLKENNLVIKNDCLEKIISQKEIYLDKTYSKQGKKSIDVAEDIGKAIQNRIKNQEPEQRLCILFNQIKDENILEKFNNYMEIKSKEEISTREFIDSKIIILENTKTILENSYDLEKSIICPSCGSEIGKEFFVSHVNNELEKLNSLRDYRRVLNESKKDFYDSIIRILKIAKDTIFENWLNNSNEIKNIISKIRMFQEKGEKEFWSSESLEFIQNNISVLSGVIDTLTSKTPLSTRQLFLDNEILKLGIQIPNYIFLNEKIIKIEKIIAFLRNIQGKIREDIILTTSQLIQDISSQIQLFWGKMHPDNLIEEVKLYIPEDQEKAIDISLKFYGVNQPSPRNTLSEGHRNSLGLCVFLALAKRIKKEINFIVLDDIVSSIDRNHRFMITEVLKNEFSDKQILLFTHDREWYSELICFLPSQNWEFINLKPWESPNVGIQFSDLKYTFQDVLSESKNNPQLAGNYLRQIMDINLSIISEKLQIQVNYFRGDKNDKRTCVDLLRRIKSEAKESLRIKISGVNEWELFSEPIINWGECIKYLIAWTDRASHGGSLTTDEVVKLVEICKKSLDYFTCSKCNTKIFSLEQRTNGRFQCNCGDVRWI